MGDAPYRSSASSSALRRATWAYRRKRQTYLQPLFRHCGNATSFRYSPSAGWRSCSRGAVPGGGSAANNGRRLLCSRHSSRVPTRRCLEWRAAAASCLPTWRPRYKHAYGICMLLLCIICSAGYLHFRYCKVNGMVTHRSACPCLPRSTSSSFCWRDNGDGDNDRHPATRFGLRFCSLVTNFSRRVTRTRFSLWRA